jgi:hypothetical protein
MERIATRMTNRTPWDHSSVLSVVLMKVPADLSLYYYFYSYLSQKYVSLVCSLMSQRRSTKHGCFPDCLAEYSLLQRGEI